MQNETKPDTGYLQVVVRTADGVLPLRDAQVLIYDADPENDSTGVLYSLRTDGDGITPVVELAAPPRALSLTPGNPFSFARYNITVHREGYGSVQNIGVPVFSGVVSTQPVTLVPLSEFETDRPEQIRETPAGSDPLQ
jgi:hypothetical protein